MFSDKELEVTKEMAGRKIKDILDSDKEFTANDLQDLQTLFKLKDGAEKQMERYEKE